MDRKNSDKTDLIKEVFDVIPSLIFVVDNNIRIHEYNAAAAEFICGTRESILKRRGGDILNCLHSIGVKEGCGAGAFCCNCVIRKSINEALLGNRVVRRRSKIEIIREGEKAEIYALISASPFQFEEKPLVLLVIEDISEIAELQRMIPICSVCKEVRDEKETWSQLEAYLKKYWDVDFSHSFCPTCFKKEMDKLKKHDSQTLKD
jgi:PAS domain-containing protein